MRCKNVCYPEDKNDFYKTKRYWFEQTYNLKLSTNQGVKYDITDPDHVYGLSILEIKGVEGIACIVVSDKEGAEEEFDCKETEFYVCLLFTWRQEQFFYRYVCYLLKGKMQESLCACTLISQRQTS